MSLTSTLSSDSSQPVAGPSTSPGPGAIRSPSPRVRVSSPKSPQPLHSRAMQKVLSQGSAASGSGSTGSAVLGTPTTGSGRMSPAGGSGGARTPKARKARLSEDAGPAGGKKDEQLAQDLGDLQVRSPLSGNAAQLPSPYLASAPAMGQDVPLLQPVPQHAAQNGGTGQGRTYSGSTDSSESLNHPIPPSQLGSMYGAEGFTAAQDQAVYPPAQPAPYPYGYSIPQTNSPEYNLTPAAAAAIAAADEAIKQLNGTSTVYKGPLSTPGPQVAPKAPENPYQLPRGYANFVKPQNRATGEHMGVSRQSSTSSSTTEASTSSEESDLCVPRIEWVDRDVGLGTSGQSQAQTWGSNFFTPYQPNRIGSSANRKGDSPARMPPPSNTNRLTSPRVRQNQAGPGFGQGSHHPSQPVGAVSSGLKKSSALPGGTAADAADEEDDDQTVGHRERSPSTSSQSAQSGLDLLLRAVTHSSNGHEIAEEPVHDGKGKRKAVATEAVDQWRNSGIPTGVKGSTAGVRYRRDSTTSTEPEDIAGQSSGAPTGAFGVFPARQPQGHGHGQPPAKKRRRSSAVDTNPDPEIDPILLREDLRRHAQSLGGDADESMQDDESEPDDGASEGGSEYGAEGRSRRAGGKGRGGAGRKAGVGVAGGAGRGRSSLPGPGTAKGGTPVPAGGPAAPGRKGRKTDSPSGLAKGGRPSISASAASASPLPTTVPVPAGGVQCDYTNPLPPYNRCQDVFTRKYDLPRHMARHARREGELVFEGKLAQDKAVLWATIKDRPKVTCQSCGESFTRMDALKRHQAKQHH